MQRARRRWSWVWTALTLLFGLPIAAAISFALWFDPNDYKDQLVQAVQDATGRTLVLRGPLRLSRSLQPTLEVSDVMLANLPGGTRDDMARAERIEGQIALLPLLRRQVEITRLVLIGPNILFEQVNGTPNWVFGAGPTEGAPAAPGAAEPTRFQLRIRRVHVENGMVTWRLPARTKVVGIRALDYRHLVDRGPLDLQSTLVYSDNQPFTVKLEAEPTGDVRAPWQTRLQFAAFDTAASATGTASLAGGFDLQVEAASGALERLNALLPEMQLPAARSVALSAHVSNGKQPGDLPVIGPAQLRFASADLRDRVPGLTLGAVQASLAAAGGRATVSGAGRYNESGFKLDGGFGVPQHLDGPVTLPVALRVDTGGDVRSRLALDGTLALTTLRFAGLETAATLETPALAGLRPVLGQQLPALTDVRFEGKLAIPKTRGQVRVKAARLTTQQGDVAGEGSVTFDSKLTLAGTWRSDNLDLDSMLEAFGIDLSPAAVPRAASGPVIPDTALPWAELSGAALSLETSAKLLKFQDQLWHDVRMAIRLKDRRLQVGPMRLALPGGPVEFSMTADGAAAAVPVSLSLRAPAIPLALVGRLAGLPDPFAGSARVEAQLQASGRTIRQAAASLQGPVAITSVGGQLSNAAMIELTGAALTALGLAVPAEGQTRLDCLGVVGQFMRGVGSFPTIALQTDSLSLEGAGQIDLAQETVSLRLSTLAQVAGSAVAVPVVVAGPFRDIKGELNASAFEQIGFLFDGLFGGDRPTACTHAGLRPTAPKPP